MSIKVRLASDAPEERSKIRVTLDGQPLTPLQLPPLAPKAPEPLPARVATFWFFDEDAHRASRPCATPRVREQLEGNGSWAGL